jgi:antitoxin component of RelBE/YafQ-DinJ toxin-antitoxin module
MSDKTHMQFRADADLADAVESVAEEEGISRSEAIRSLLTEGLANLGGDLQHVADRQQLEQIKDEEHTRQRRAWYRHNVGSQLLKCWNGGLTPDEAFDATHGYRREAEEMHEDEDLAEYLQDGLRVYQAAYPDNGAKLSTWLKTRGPNADTEIEIEDQGAAVEDATDADPETAHPTMTVGEAAREFAAFDWEPEAIDRDDVSNVDGSAAEVRERLRELYAEEEEEADRDE